MTGESAWETDGKKNPLTTTYTVRECLKLFKEFENVTVEKVGGRMSHIGKIGKYIPKFFDGLVDKSLGPTLNITAHKPKV